MPEWAVILETLEDLKEDRSYKTTVPVDPHRLPKTLKGWHPPTKDASMSPVSEGASLQTEGLWQPPPLSSMDSPS